MNKKEIIKHYEDIALEVEKWKKKNSYYHSEISRYHRFHIQEGSSILEIGCENGDLLASLKPRRGLGIDASEGMIKAAKKKYGRRKNLQFRVTDLESFKTKEKFEYVIISGTLGRISDVQLFLKRVSTFCTPDSRIMINHYNHHWSFVLRLGEKLRLKMPEKVKNWLSVGNIENFLYVTGYEVLKKDSFLLVPKKIPLISPLINKTIAKFPLLRRLCVSNIITARPLRPPDNATNLTASVVITCRDEKESIEGLVKRTPNMGKHTEIIFVEGHSKDGTPEEIKRMMKKYPNKDIKLLTQDGIGQGDAFRKGYDRANGDFVLWLEADLTTPPEELAKFWDVFISGRGEYVNGTRMVYGMDKNAMPRLNFIGNRGFGKLFTWLLGQRFTDTLCGLKAISKRNYIKIRKEIEFFGDFDPFGDFELIFGVAKNNLKVTEVPVKYVPRQYGETKTKPFKHGLLLIRMSFIAFRKFKLF